MSVISRDYLKYNHWMFVRTGHRGCACTYSVMNFICHKSGVRKSEIWSEFFSQEKNNWLFSEMVIESSLSLTIPRQILKFAVTWFASNDSNNLLPVMLKR